MEQTQQQERVANNKLIAKFMGGNHIFDGDPEWGGGWTWVGLKHGIYVNSPDLLYHDSWDWLMPVVEKIESLNVKILGVTTSFDVTIVYGDCNIQDEDGLFVQFYEHSTDSQSKIEATYKAVVEFINWYNKNEE